MSINARPKRVDIKICKKSAQLISENNEKKYPQNYAEWLNAIMKSTIKTHDPKLFNMIF